MKGIVLIRSLLCLGLCFSGRVIADDASLEYKVKAGYLYNFTKFVTWPEIKGDTFNLCILGSDPFGDIIDPIEEKTAFALPIKIIRLDEEDSLSKSASKSDCHILYVGGTNSQKLVFDALQVSTKKGETLIVGESEAFATNGGMIGFINKDGKIKLQINLQSVKRTGLKISAKLLEIAEIIR
jgi:hypothetical protein